MTFVLFGVIVGNIKCIFLRLNLEGDIAWYFTGAKLTYVHYTTQA